MQTFAVWARILGEELEQGVVGFVDIGRIAREGDPAEGAATDAKLLADIGGHETREGEGALEAVVFGALADVVAVVEGNRAAVLEFYHRAHVACQGIDAEPLVVCWIIDAGLGSFREGVLDGHVALEGVVRGGLVGQDIGGDVAFEQALEEFEGVGVDADGDRLAFFGELNGAVDGVVKTFHDLIEVAVVEATLQTGEIDIGDEAGALGERDGQGLRATHPAATGGDAELSFE